MCTLYLTQMWSLYCAVHMCIVCIMHCMHMTQMWSVTVNFPECAHRCTLNPPQLDILGFCAHFRFTRIAWFANMCSFRILDRGLGLVKVILPELAFISPSWIKERIFVDLVILHLSWTYLRKNRTRCSEAWGAFEYTDARAVQGKYKKHCQMHNGPEG